MAAPLRVLSLGAGVQSSVLALMASRGEIEAPDCAIFADTGAEPASVYEWLDWLEPRLSFPLHRVQHGSLERDEGEIRQSARSGFDYVKVSAPYWAHNDGKAGGPLGRKCTRDYKIAAVQRKIRRLLGIYGKRSPSHTVAVSLLGISTDEAHRMKPSRDSWVSNAYPLIDLGMSRADCIAWALNNGLPEPPRSACVFCPFHSAEEWRRLQTEEPQEYARACAHEDRLRHNWKQVLGMNPHPQQADDLFLQKLIPGVPLREIDWTAAMESEEPPAQLTLWGNECEGLCGV
jgi:hypothetical protein